MSRIFVGNFDFEEELARSPVAASSLVADAPGVARQTPVQSIVTERFWSWLPIAGADDVVIAPHGIDGRDFDGLVRLGLTLPRFVDRPEEIPEEIKVPEGSALVPWGWTSSIVAMGRPCGWECAAPPVAVVREVNSRAFRLALEQQFQIGVPGTASAVSLEELDQIIRRCGDAPGGWLLKANFGMSGREALRGRGTKLDERTRNWARKRLEYAGPVIVEPIIERLDEAGVQFEIPQTGPPQLVGVTPLLVDRSGVYRGSRFGCPASELAVWQPAVDVGQRVAQTIHQLGYFGPLGLDAMRFRDAAGEVHLRPLQDLNARFTMGRLALGFLRILPPGWCGTWLHFGRRHLAGREIDRWLNEVRRSLPANVTTTVTSPRKIGSQPVEFHAVVVLAATPGLRRQAENAILGSLGIDAEIG